MKDFIQNIIKEFDNLDKIDWYTISHYQTLSEEFIEKFRDKLNWDCISRFQRLSEEFIEKYQYIVNWDYISQFQKLSEEFIERHQDKVHWGCISKFQILSEEFIERHQDKVNWDCISRYQRLSEEFIERHQYKVYWECVSVLQKLSEEFIEKHKNKVSLSYISAFQKLSGEFMIKHNITSLPVNNWLYATDQKKLECLNRLNLYEISEDGSYIIAYKGVRSDGYSRFNFQYKYEVGKTYEDFHCDCELNHDNSFGLGAWTLKEAIKYCNEKVLKVKIYIKDIGAIVCDGGKIRCWKLEVLEEVNYENHLAMTPFANPSGQYLGRNGNLGG